MGWLEAIDGLAWLDENAMGFLLMCLVYDVKKVKKVPGDKVSLPEEYGNLIEEVMQRTREKTVDFGRGRGIRSTLRVNESSRKGVVVFSCEKTDLT